MRDVGTIVRGIRTPIIKEGDDLATIGKIAGEQLIKLMTLGLSKKKAEETIINDFLK